MVPDGIGAATISVAVSVGADLRDGTVGGLGRVEAFTSADLASVRVVGQGSVRAVDRAGGQSVGLEVARAVGGPGRGRAVGRAAAVVAVEAAAGVAEAAAGVAEAAAAVAGGDKGANRT